MLTDYYQVLGVQYTATPADIKAAYRRLAMQYHPDKNKDPHAQKMFIEITEAYEVLCDREKRAAYDFLYTRYFVNTEFGATTDPSYQKQQGSWAEQGKRKAQEYASMPYNEFAQRVFSEIKVGARYIPNLIFIFFCLLGAITLIKVLPEVFSDRDAPVGIGIVVLMGVVGFGLLAYFLIKRMKDDYLHERNHTFKK